MKNTTTLLVIDIDTSDSAITDFAESAFQEQTHLSCLMIGPAPALPMALSEETGLRRAGWFRSVYG